MVVDRQRRTGGFNDRQSPERPANRRRHWPNRQPAAFFACGQTGGFALGGAGCALVAVADRQCPAAQPAAALGWTLFGTGTALVTVLLVWGLVRLARRRGADRKAGPDWGGHQAAVLARVPPPVTQPPVIPRPVTSPPVTSPPVTPPAARADRDARRRPEPRLPAPAERRVKVLMLGDSGSGKTTLLASLYHCFVLGGSAGIRFATDDSANGRLFRLVTTIRDAREAVITTGTRPAETANWEFAVQVESGDQETTAFTLEYLDYPGGYVERRLRPDASGDPPDPRFERELATADVLMGILDGEKLSRLMNGTQDLRAILAVENLLNILARAGQRNIHLVVTKWDLLRGPGGAFYSIADVRDMLDRESSAFRSFLRSPRLGNLRIIPVSALGVNGFVRADAAVPGGMAKVPGRPWQPWNVQVPFFCAVPDILRHDTARLAGRLDGNIARITRAVLDMAGIATVQASMAGLISVTIPVGEILARIWKCVHDMNERGRPPAALSDNSAISYVLSECYAHVEEFERQFPDSRVSRPAARV